MYISYPLCTVHSTEKPVTTMLTYPWKCTGLQCNHLGNTWKPLVLMTRHFDYCPSASEGDNQSVRSSAPLVSRCFPGGYTVKLYISRGRLAWWLLAFLHSAPYCVQLCSKQDTSTFMLPDCQFCQWSNLKDFSEHVKPFIPTQTLRKMTWPYTIIRLTAHFLCVLMSDLVIWKHRKEYNVWSYMTLNVLIEIRCLKQLKLYIYTNKWGEKTQYSSLAVASSIEDMIMPHYMERSSRTQTCHSMKHNAPNNTPTLPVLTRHNVLCKPDHTDTM